MTTTSASPASFPASDPTALTPGDIRSLRTATDKRPALAQLHTGQLAAAAVITPPVEKKAGRPAKAPASPKRRGPATKFTDGTGVIDHDFTCEFGHAITHDHARVGAAHFSWGETSWARRHAIELMGVFGQFSDGHLSRRDVLIVGGVNSHVGEEASKLIKDYTPHIDPAAWIEIGPFVRDIVTLTAPRTIYTARAVLSPVTHFVFWCRRHAALPLVAPVLFNRLTIERYVVANPAGLKVSSMRNYRAMLLRIADILRPDDVPLPMRSLNGNTMAPPYAEKDLKNFIRWANGQNTELRTRHARAMISICTGAGLSSGELMALTGRDIQVDASGILITVTGVRARQVPVLARWEPMVLDAIKGRAPDAHILGGRTTPLDVTNLSSLVVRSKGNERPYPDRLRATWIVTHLSAATPMRALMTASGYRTFQNLAKYLAHVPALDTVTYREVLRAEANR
jgi:hypothetical protein